MANQTEADVVALQAVPEHDSLLAVATSGKQIPFAVQRAFLVRADEDGVKRGEHAHRRLHQFMICVAGEVEVVVDNGAQRRSHVLNSIERGLHVPPGVWAQQSYRKGAVLLVLCDAPYEESDYIRDYDEFIHMRRG
jgi:UDP-2-acetamido-3-amino-2,3-dideoxy-glucuronate N-acetyltransferase